MKQFQILTFLFIGLFQFSNAQVHNCIDILAETTNDEHALSGVFSERSKWANGSNIKVRFTGGQSVVIEKVKKYAKYWETYANITFTFIESGTCDILVSFQMGKGSWSYVGKDSRTKAQANIPSMNFGWFDQNSSDYEIKRTTLHEFGHALGLLHEHVNPDGEINWNKPVVYNYYMNQGWTVDQINNNIFGKYSVDLSNRKYDKNSIMHYPIPKEHTLDGYGVAINYDLSAADKELIAEMYPKSTTPKPTETNSGSVTAKLKDIEVKHNTYSGTNYTDKGLELQLDFEIANAKGKKCRAIAYFFYSDGTALRDFNSTFYTTKGNVASSSDFTPAYDNAAFTDLKVFIPYDELHMGEGEHQLKFTVTLWDENNKELINSGAYYFTYSKGAIVENFKLNVNTTHATNKMYLMPKFTIKNAENLQCQACAYFFDSNSKPLKDSYGYNLKFCTSFKPGYSTAVYNSLALSDLYIEIDYNSIPIPYGTSNVKYFLALHQGGKQIETSQWQSIRLKR